MPRYLIERSFPDGLSIPLNADGKKAVVAPRQQCPSTA